MYCGTEKAESIGVSQNCAIALALKDVFGMVSVCDTVTIYGIYQGRKPYTCIPLPKDAIDFTISFDRLSCIPERRLLLPELEFEIDLPQEVIDAINIDDIVKSETLELV